MKLPDHFTTTLTGVNSIKGFHLTPNKKSKSNDLLFCEPDWIRTNDLLLRRQLLYPAELPVLFLSQKYSLIFLRGCKSKF